VTSTSCEISLFEYPAIQIHWAICWSTDRVFITESTHGRFMYFKNGGSVCCAETLLRDNIVTISRIKDFDDFIKFMLMNILKANEKKILNIESSQK
jgi:hypothetical protein